MKEVRPTSNKVLLALFNILGEKIRGCKFLDLFAGTGSIGLEAIKRGAESCVFVESVKARADSIKKKSDSPTKNQAFLLTNKLNNQCDNHLFL